MATRTTERRTRFRRRFTTEYKLRILTEIDGLAHGQVKVVLDREGLRTSHVSAWRHQVAQGLPRGLGSHFN